MDMHEFSIDHNEVHYIVKVEGKDYPKATHHVLEEARKEAARLAEKETGCRVSVFEVKRIAACTADPPKAAWEGHDI